MENRKRSIVKSFVWKTTGFITLATVSYFVTGSFKEMSIITILYHGIGIVLYYIHERVWERIRWGKVEHPLSVIEIEGEINEKDIDLIRKKLQELGYVK